MTRSEHLIPENMSADHVLQAAKALTSGEQHAFHDSTKFDLIVEGGRYPPKAILALAAKQYSGIELLPGDFSGGLGSKCFRILEGLGFEIVPKSSGLLAHDFQVGRVYNRRKDVHSIYGGQEQGGIVTPKNCPFIFLFVTESGEKWGYRDGWNSEGVFLYTGEGQKGDQEFTRGNKAIRDHAADGRTLEVFESLGKGKGVRYLGAMHCASYERIEGGDSDGENRKLLLFHLIADGEEQEDLEVESVSLAQARQRALDAASSSAMSRTGARQNFYYRSAHVKQYVLQRSKGICELCGSPAPFEKKDGAPYLEPHHTRRVADNGPDHPRWVGALCPNCHREIHSGKNGEIRNAELIDRLGKLEP